MLLNCTPNDLLEWHNGNADESLKNHPLATLKQEKLSLNLMSELRSIPLHQLNELQDMLKNLKGK